ncbi:PDZ domain-containing protein [Bacillus infantis]|uniref:PDZ domain-containing protein n=1 Tax=Bacillus infantis TaxID=324767 RepID=A0A5D4SC84_9BACI|nr:PDZ domain-containing protein [Bacillus infantis]TYS60589.1 PDZ domain-containing protein [Bacillus infantis]
MDKEKLSTVNSIFIESEIENIWWYLSTLEGWNNFLTDVAEHTENKNNNKIEIGDEVNFIIGELSNSSLCIILKEPNLIVFWDRYKGLLPDGTTRVYELHTSFELKQISEKLVKVTVKVDGYDTDEMMQWIRECGEMGWRQTLINLKCILELGLDLRNEIFNYPRIGVINYTATPEQLTEAKSPERGNYIRKVYSNSPSYHAGLIEGDIVTHINDKSVETYHKFVKALSSSSNRDHEVFLTIVRDGEILKKKIILTYDDQFTGMIDPAKTPLSEVEASRKEKSKIEDKQR